MYEEVDRGREFRSVIEGNGGMGRLAGRLVAEGLAKYRRADGTYADPEELDGTGSSGMLIAIKDLSEDGFPWP